MVPALFHDRAEAGRLLAAELRDAPLMNPLVLAIPRGGVEVGGALAEGIGADLDVVLSRKLRSPIQPELALGAVSESGEVYLNQGAGVAPTEGSFEGVVFEPISCFTEKESALASERISA